jgi:hypothetical protein
VVFLNEHIDHYLQPESGNFGAVDGLCLKHVYVDMYQMTVNKNHGISGAALGHLIDKILSFFSLPPAATGSGSDITIRFIFVVPNYMFDQFKPQQADSIGEHYKKYIEQSVIGLKTTNILRHEEIEEAEEEVAEEAVVVTRSGRKAKKSKKIKNVIRYGVSL